MFEKFAMNQKHAIDSKSNKKSLDDFIHFCVK